MGGISFLATAFVCLFISFILSEISLKFKYPRVIGQIFTGFILSLPLFAIFFQGETMSMLAFMSELGVVFLMLLTGLSLNLKEMKAVERDSIPIAIFGVVFPFSMGVGLMRLIGYDWTVALVVGACLSLTAEGTTLEVLYDLKALRTKLGSIIISTGIMDDLFELFFLSGLLVLLQGGSFEFGGLAINAIAFGIIIFMLFKILPILLKFVHKDRVEFSSFALTVLFGLFIASLAAEFRLSVVFGALLAGALLNYTEGENYDHKINVKNLELVTFTLFVPFFFINIGLNFDFAMMIANLPLVLIVLVVAILGKLLGAFAAKPFTDLSFKQLHVVGWAMNCRGLVELVIATFAYGAGLIPVEIFSALVAMAVVTTFLFPVMVKYLVKDRKIWYD